MSIIDLIGEFRNKSYDSGWISGKIEAGGIYDVDAQANCISQRNDLQVELEHRITTLMDALEKAPKPMTSLTAEELKSNWKAVDHWFAIYDAWMDDVAKQALSLVKGDSND